MKLICTNDKRDSETKFTSPEFCFPFAQTVNRSAHVNGKQVVIQTFWSQVGYTIDKMSQH